MLFMLQFIIDTTCHSIFFYFFTEAHGYYCTCGHHFKRLLKILYKILLGLQNAIQDNNGGKSATSVWIQVENNLKIYSIGRLWYLKNDAVFGRCRSRCGTLGHVCQKQIQLHPLQKLSRHSSCWFMQSCLPPASQGLQEQSVHGLRGVHVKIPLQRVPPAIWLIARTVRTAKNRRKKTWSCDMILIMITVLKAEWTL